MGIKRIAGSCVRRMSGNTLMVRSLERELLPRLRQLSQSLPPGARVLDIGSKHALYRAFFPHCAFHRVDVERNHRPDVIADVHELSRTVPESSYDAILCTEVLEHTRNPALAVEEMRKVLKPGGIMLATTPFIIPYHPDPQDFWRMTAEGWKVLTEGFSRVEIIPHGNQMLCVWYLAGMGWGMPLRLLDRVVFELFGRLRDARSPLGFIVAARRCDGLK